MGMQPAKAVALGPQLHTLQPHKLDVLKTPTPTLFLFLHGQGPAATARHLHWPTLLPSSCGKCLDFLGTGVHAQ